MYKLKFCVSGTFHASWDVEDPVAAFKQLSDWCYKKIGLQFSPIRENDIYVLFQVSNNEERVIQIYHIQKNEEQGFFVVNVMPHDWWWTDEMKEEFEEN